MKGFAILITVEDEYFDEIKGKLNSDTLCNHTKVQCYYEGVDDEDYDSLRHSFINNI